MIKFLRRSNTRPAPHRCTRCGTPAVVQIVDLAANSRSGFCRNCNERWEVVHDLSEIAETTH